jgi:hypothetical protein
MEGKDVTTMNRRSFLKAAGVAGLGAAVAGLSSCAPSGSKSSAKNASDDQVENLVPDSTEECDIVVVGGGASGLSAATRAAELGKHVVLLEKSSDIGGASLSVYSATVHQADDDITQEVNDWVADCHWRVDATVINNMLHKSGEAFNWLQNNYGWKFDQVVSFGKKQWKVPGAAADRKKLYQDMLSKVGVDLRTGMTAKQLVQSNGAVTGVIAQNSDGKNIQFNCKAISVATGGYAGNAQMVQDAFGFGGVCGGLPQNIGEGLKMMWAVGGKKPINYGSQMLHQTLTPCTATLTQKFDDLPAKYPLLTSYLGAFMNVTAKGQRFRNEGIITSADAAANSSGLQGPFHYVVVSKGQIDQLATGGLAAWGYTAKPSLPPADAPKYDLATPWANAQASFDAMADGQNGFKGDTFEALGTAAGMDGKAFAAECQAYEEYCAAGKDTELGKEADLLRPMGSGPYYLVKAQQNNLTSWGGVATDIVYRVLNDNGDPIPGLYAIGVESGSNLYNDTYMGVGIGVCLVFTSGYLTGGRMSEYVDGK